MGAYLAAVFVLGQLLALPYLVGIPGHPVLGQPLLGHSPRMLCYQNVCFFALSVGKG